MTRRFLNILGTLAALSFAASACKEVPENQEPEPQPEPDKEVVAPVATMKVDALDRTSVTFTVKSDSDGDYAWAIVPADQTIESAEDLFESGKTGMFGAEKTFSTTYNELEGGKTYNLYAAVRKINPYVYSELLSETLSTEFEYEDMITLEKVTPTAISYHIEKPEGVDSYKHMIVDYNDFLYFQAMVGVTHNSYVSAFGLSADESGTFEYEWFQNDAYAEAGDTGGYPTYFYSDTKYMVIAGKSDMMGFDGQVAPEDVKYVEFTTPKAEKCPYDVAVEVTDITSMTAVVHITPEEGVERYRAMVMSEADYQSFLFEGEEMVRRAVIGPWDDYSTEYKEAVTMPMSGLIPNSNYYICLVAFDKDMRELYIEEVFTTGEPVGPAPEIEIAAVEVKEPWNSASVNLKIRNAVSAMSFVHTKLAVEDVLNKPGNEDLTIADLIPTNGISFSAAELSKALSEDGCTVSFANLSPNTEYIYAIKATNEEHVSAVMAYEFKTGAEPVIESTLFKDLQGEYTATITDLDGVEHTFDVTITDGVNDATREDYAAENLLVCLGFDPISQYYSPQDLLDNGWAADEAEANRNYGPKWFLEIDKKDNITTYKHAVASSFYDEVNMVEIVNYSAEGEDPMLSCNGNTYWFKGTFWRDFSSPNREDMAMATTLIHDVDYDAEAGTITVNPVSHYKSWSAKGQLITEYPGVEKASDWAGGNGSEVVFCGNSALVLTRKAEAQQQAVSFSPVMRPLKAPVIRPIDVQETRPVIRGR